MTHNLKLEISRCQRYQRSIAVVLLDLDFFKLLNDTYGHAAGDRVLKAFADQVNNNIRASDTLYRYGGEEFLLMLPETSVETAAEVAEKIRQAIEAMPLDFQKKAVLNLTVSQGIACYPQHGNDYQTLIQAADKALYQAKSQGRNCFCIASSS